MGLLKKEPKADSAAIKGVNKPKKGFIICPFCGGEFAHEDVCFSTEVVTGIVDERVKNFWSGSTMPEVVANEAMKLVISGRQLNQPLTVGEETVTPLQVLQEGGMVTEMAYDLVIGEERMTKNTNRRCCPHCHNRLNADYGRFPVKFISVVGIRRSGKTVYIKQLLRNIGAYCARWGIDANTGSLRVADKNMDWIRAGEALPVPTPNNEFQPPKFVDITYGADARKKTVTLVFYDIAGEAFDADEYGETTVNQFGKYIWRSDGVILLMDMPNQAGIMANVKRDENTELNVGSTEIMTVPNILRQHYRDGEMPPVAVTISKCDELAENAVAAALPDFARILTKAMEPDSSSVLGFNAAGHKSRQHAIEKLMEICEPTITTQLNHRIGNCNYFAVESLGCAVEGNRPVGPLNPKHVDEPLGWLLSKMGIVETVYNG